MVGSQAILHRYNESKLPAAATTSIKVAIIPIADGDKETSRLAVLIEGAAREFSLLSSCTASASMVSTYRPPSCRTNGERLTKVRNAHSSAPASEPQFT